MNEELERENHRKLAIAASEFELKDNVERVDYEREKGFADSRTQNLYTLGESAAKIVQHDIGLDPELELARTFNHALIEAKSQIPALAKSKLSLQDLSLVIRILAENWRMGRALKSVAGDVISYRPLTEARAAPEFTITERASVEDIAKEWQQEIIDKIKAKQASLSEDEAAERVVRATDVAGAAFCEVMKRPGHDGLDLVKTFVQAADVLSRNWEEHGAEIGKWVKEQNSAKLLSSWRLMNKIGSPVASPRR